MIANVKQNTRGILQKQNIKKNNLVVGYQNHRHVRNQMFTVNNDLTISGTACPKFVLGVNK